MEEPVTLARVYLNTVQRVNADIEELSSYASFVLLLPSSKTILVWVGRSCSPIDRNLAETIAFDSLRADFDKSGELSQIYEDRANSSTLALQILLKALNSKYDSYTSLENERLLKKISNLDKCLSIITKKGDGTFIFKKLITKSTNANGTVERISFPAEVDTTRHSILLSVGNFNDLWLGELVTKKDKEGIKKFMTDIAMEKVPAHQRDLESLLFSSSLKIFDNDSRDITIFKYNFLEESSRKIVRNNLLKKIEETRQSIPKTSTNVDQCSDCVGDMFFRLLGLASSPTDISQKTVETKGNNNINNSSSNNNNDSSSNNIVDREEFVSGHTNGYGYENVALKLEKLISRTSIQYIHAPRKKKNLLVLDLDHTLMDFSCRSDFTTELLKRPYMDYFLATTYAYYDIAIWSQTNWKWLELKLKELGMLKSNNYKICFALDKSNMFTVKHSYVKPLQLIWSKCPDLWGSHNTLHIDDLSKNFELNKSSGVLVTPFYLKESHNDTNGDGDLEMKGTKNVLQKTNSNGVLTKLERSQSAPEIQKAARDDVELLLLSKYLVRIAQTCNDFASIDHSGWKGTVSVPPTKVPV